MRGHECYHCKQWVNQGEPHDCWSTTEAALTADLPEDLREAYARLRETAVELGEQRIYASHNSIMFSRKACYLFVRPKRTHLEVCIFLARTIRAPQIRRAAPASKVKIAHILQVRHRDEVEAPITDWMREAYALQDIPLARPPDKPKPEIATARRKGKARKVETRKGRPRRS